MSRFGISPSWLRRVGARRNIHWVADGPQGRLVLCQYAADRSHADVAYELRLLEHLNSRGWPVPVPVAPLIEYSGAIWGLFTHVLGRPPRPRSESGARAEQKKQGRLLARLHAAMADLITIGQREGWRRADEGLWERSGKADSDEVLRHYERLHPEPGRILRTYRDAANKRLTELLPHAPDPIVIHGDFAPWNLRYVKGMLSGILDFDSAHLDLRVADFALSWRGKHVGVIEGYEDESRLGAVERELIVPVFWAWVVSSAVAGIDAGDVTAEGTEWAITHLLRTDIDRPQVSTNLLHD